MKHINSLNSNPYNCSGCSACQSVCPKQCINMISDKEGFLYPNVDENVCVQCGLCTQVCPWLNEQQPNIEGYPKVYAVKHKLDLIRENSTSGGAFSSIAEYVLSLEGVIYGAAFIPETQRVEHICIRQNSDLYKLRGSKYVQSYIGDTYRNVREDLKDGKYVLFVGTPCQCDGLKCFLQKDYPKLYIVDILCHGVPSPLMLHDTLLSYGGDVTDIKFRDKSLGWRDSYHFQIMQKDKVITNETYLNLYFRGVLSRKSCYHCQYMTTIRVSDLTIGDYWNISNALPSFEDKLGVSCILVNCPKGGELLQNCLPILEYRMTPLEPAIQGCMHKFNKEPKLRESFWKDYSMMPYEYCMKKYGHYTCWEKIKGKSYRYILKFLKKVF